MLQDKGFIFPTETVPLLRLKKFDMCKLYVPQKQVVFKPSWATKVFQQQKYSPFFFIKLEPGAM